MKCIHNTAYTYNIPSTQTIYIYYTSDGHNSDPSSIPPSYHNESIRASASEEVPAPWEGPAVDRARVTYIDRGREVRVNVGC